MGMNPVAMTINKHDRLETTEQLRDLLKFYKETEKYNHCVKASGIKRSEPQFYWAVDWQVFDPTVSGLIRYKVLYIGTRESFYFFQKEIDRRIEMNQFQPLQMREMDAAMGQPGMDTGYIELIKPVGDN